MDSYYPRHSSEDNTDWEEVEAIPVPAVAKDRKISFSTSAEVQHNEVQHNEVHSKLNPPDPLPKDISVLKTLRESKKIPSASSEEREDLMTYLSETLRKNSFIESKARILSTLNQQLSDKNVFLQDQFLILKEKHESILQNNSRFIQALQNNSQELKALKETFSTLKSSLKSSEAERKHLLGLNRHIVGKLSSLLKENKQIKAKELQFHTHTHHPSARKQSLEGEAEAGSEPLNKAQNTSYKKELETVKKSISQYYKAEIQNLKESLKFNEKNYLSQIKHLKKHNQHIKDKHEQVELQTKKNNKNLEIKYQKEIQSLTNKHKEELAGLEKNHITLKQESLKQIQELGIEHKKVERELKKKYESDIADILKQNSTLKQGHLKQIQQLTNEHKKSERILKETHEQSIKKVKSQHLKELKISEEKQEQLIKETEKTKQQIMSQADRVLLKYKRLKEQWNTRLIKVITKKNDLIKKIKYQYEEQKNHIALAFKKQEMSIKREYEGKLKTTKAEFEKHINEKQKEQEQKSAEEKTKSEKLLMEKEKIISELKIEVENWSQNYADYELDIQKKLKQTSEKEKLSLINEKETALIKMEQYYKSLISSIKEKQSQELKALQEKQDEEFYTKSSLLDERIIEIKEEHDNQLHYLRQEMENELLAEKRKSVAENEKNNNEIQKLQKTLLELQSEKELKNLKIINMQLETTTNTEELEQLKEDNKTLKQESNKLKVFWESYGLKLEEQQQQIQSLQKLNRQLSQYIQNSQDGVYLDSGNQFKNPATHNSLRESSKVLNSKKKNNIQELLRQIHIHEHNP